MTYGSYLSSYRWVELHQILTTFCKRFVCKYTSDRCKFIEIEDVNLVFNISFLISAPAIKTHWWVQLVPSFRYYRRAKASLVFPACYYCQCRSSLNKLFKLNRNIPPSVTRPCSSSSCSGLRKLSLVWDLFSVWKSNGSAWMVLLSHSFLVNWSN